MFYTNLLKHTVNKTINDQSTLVHLLMCIFSVSILTNIHNSNKNLHASYLENKSNQTIKLTFKLSAANLTHKDKNVLKHTGNSKTI